MVSKPLRLGHHIPPNIRTASVPISLFFINPVSSQLSTSSRHSHGIAASDDGRRRINSQPLPPPTRPITLEISTGPCKILVRGKRSTKGWVILDTPGGAKEPTPIAKRKSKEEAIQCARDACEPGTSATFTVQPSQD